MLILLSPAKTLDFETETTEHTRTKPEMLKEAEQLASVLKNKSEDELADLMSLSDKLASLNAERYAAWKANVSQKNDRQAALAFKGDVYQGLEAETFDKDELDFAQEHLRILSGLYGVLKPLDLIKPYRLEMGTLLQVNGHKNLYQFWGDKITENIMKQLKKLKSNTLINLASQEYFKAVNTKLLKDVNIVSPAFKDLKNGKYKVISFYAKKARGQMSAWVIRNKIESEDELKLFNVDGYEYNDNLSKADIPVFTRG